jgi:hypothetical protein
MRFAPQCLAAAFFVIALGSNASAQTTAAPPSMDAPATAPTALPTASGIAVVGGTPIKISLVEQIASNTAHAGDKLRFRTLDTVTTDGWIVVEKGALGEAQVLSAESAGGNGHPGKMQLQFDWVYGVDGLKIQLSDVPENQNGEGQKGGASTATIASYLVLGPLGLFAHNFVHGKDIIVKPDQKIQVYVAQTVHIVPKARVTTADGFAH